MAQIISDADPNGKRVAKVTNAPEETLAAESETGAPEAKKTEAAPEPADPNDEALQELKRQLAAEKQARISAEQARVQAERQVNAARTETEDTNLRLVENAIETVKANMAALKSAYAQAAAVGDWDAAANAQEGMATNGARLLQLENGKTAMAEQAKRPRPEPKIELDPVEALASQLTPRSAAWVRAHPEYARDKVLYGKMLAAHNLVAADHVPDSDGYFHAVEEALKVRRSPVAEAEEAPLSEAAEPVRRRSAPPAAPVSRNNPGMSNPRSVRLSAEEAEIASLNKMTPQEYYEQKQRIARETTH